MQTWLCNIDHEGFAVCKADEISCLCSGGAFFGLAPGGFEAQFSQLIWIWFWYGLAGSASLMVHTEFCWPGKKSYRSYLNGDWGILVHWALRWVSPPTLPPRLGPLKGRNVSFPILSPARFSCERGLQRVENVPHYLSPSWRFLKTKIRVLKALRSPATRVLKPICPGVLSSTECSWGNIGLKLWTGEKTRNCWLRFSDCCFHGTEVPSICVPVTSQWVEERLVTPYTYPAVRGCLLLREVLYKGKHSVCSRHHTST